jgi:TPR repeat protein
MALAFFRRWLAHGDAQRVETAPSPGAAAGVEAEFARGLRFAKGEGVTQDYAQAADCYARAAEQDHGPAQLKLAMMYRQGQGVARDPATSLTWLTRAARLGDAAAQYRLGVQQHLAAREERAGAASEGRVEALKWVRLAAAQGHREAEGACEFVALGMTRPEVAEAGRRVEAFVPGKPDNAGMGE